MSNFSNSFREVSLVWGMLLSLLKKRYMFEIVSQNWSGKKYKKM